MVREGALDSTVTPAEPLSPLGTTMMTVPGAWLDGLSWVTSHSEALGQSKGGARIPPGTDLRHQGELSAWGAACAAPPVPGRQVAPDGAVVAALAIASALGQRHGHTILHVQADNKPVRLPQGLPPVWADAAYAQDHSAA